MSEQHSDHYVIPVKYYVAVLIALLVLTVITVWSAQFDFGRFNIVLAMIIASVKAGCVITIFMGVKWDEAFNKVVLFGSIPFIVLFLAFTIADVFTRGDIYPNEDEIFDIKSPVKIVSELDAHHSDDHH